MEVMSKNITMRRWLRSSSGLATPFLALKMLWPVCPLMVASLRGAASSTLSKSKLESCCGLPFSRMVKSLAVSPRTTSPVFLSRTTTFVSTMSLLIFSENDDRLGGCCWSVDCCGADCWAGDCCAESAGTAAIAMAAARVRVWRRLVMFKSPLKADASEEGELPHVGGRGHLPVGCGAEWRVDAR